MTRILVNRSIRHRRIYALLKASGHSPSGANDVLTDARRKRGDDRAHARRWIGILFRSRHSLRSERAVS